MTKASLYERYQRCYEKLATDDLIKPFDGTKLERHKNFKSFIGNVDNCIIIDIGSSQGLFLSLIDSKFKIAFDISITYLKLVKTSEMHPIRGDSEELPFKNNSLDIVVCSDILEHVLNPEKSISEIKRILKPHGKLFVMIPWQENLDYYKIYKDRYEFTHLRNFDEESIRELLKGFKIIKFEGTIPKDFTIFPSPILNFMLNKIVPNRIKLKFNGTMEMMIECVIK